MTALSDSHPFRALGRSLIAVAALFTTAIAPAPSGPLSPSKALAQDPAEVLPASLHMRLGLAADGYRTGESVFVVAQQAPPHHVAIVAMTREEADRTLAGLADPEAYRTYEVVTERDFSEKPPSLLVIGHMPFTWCRPAELVPGGPCGSLNTPATSIPMAEIDSMRFQVFHDGPTLTWMFGGTDIDALFLTYAAFERFYGPYIAQVYGTQAAEQIRQELADYLDGLPIR